MYKKPTEYGIKYDASLCWVDTPENRETIRKHCKKVKEYSEDY